MAASVPALVSTETTGWAVVALLMSGPPGVSPGGSWVSAMVSTGDFSAQTSGWIVADAGTACIPSATANDLFSHDCPLVPEGEPRLNQPDRQPRWVPVLELANR